MIIPFEPEYRQKFYGLLEQVFDSNYLSEGNMVTRFESEFSTILGGGMASVATCNCGLGLIAAFEYVDVKGREVIVPSNTFMATARAVQKAGGTVVYGDCNRDDLCLSFEDMKRRVTSKTKAVVVVHIGGHIAFEIDVIAAWLKERNISLIEDCAHAHGADWNGRVAGSWGIAGVYSFYATKTMPLGEGGMVVTSDSGMEAWLRKWRNYGKFEYAVPGMNCRMNEVTAAFGLVQLQRVPMVFEWKRALAARYDQIFDNRLRFPEGMNSGYYKYIVFDTPVLEKTGAVFDALCHEIEGDRAILPNSIWIRDHHACLPIYYGWDGAELSMQDLTRRLIG